VALIFVMLHIVSDIETLLELLRHPIQQLAI